MELYLKSGDLFSTNLNRVVHGERGDYIEFEEEHIVIPLFSEYDKCSTQLVQEGYYYMWLYPKNNEDVKVYYQLRTVKYADYKLFKYYVSPQFFKDFKDPEKLF